MRKGSVISVVFLIFTMIFSKIIVSTPMYLSSSVRTIPSYASPINIDIHPSDILECKGDTVRFNIQASGDIMKYIWEKDNIFIPDSDSSILTLKNINNSNTGKYRAYIISNSLDTIISNYATLKLISFTPLIQHPSDIKICRGGDAVFRVKTNNKNIRYQWKREGFNINSEIYDSLCIKTATESDIGRYYVEITNECNDRLYSQAARLNFYEPLSISQQPFNTSVCITKQLELNVKAEGGLPKYKWKKNGIPLYGQNSETLKIVNLNSNSKGKYSVEISDVCGAMLESRVVTVSLFDPVKLLKDIEDKSVCSGDDTYFEISAIGKGVKFKWRKNSIIIPGVNSTIMHLNNISISDVSDYDVIITSECEDTIFSRKADLKIYESPKIVENITHKSVCKYENADFTVKADGYGLSYQWRKDGILIPNSNRKKLSIYNANTDNTGDYDVVVTNICKETTNSSKAKLVVFDHPKIIRQPKDIDACLDSEISLKIEATGRDLVYNWKKDGSSFKSNIKDLIITDSKASDAGLYYAEVSSSCGEPVRSNKVNVKFIKNIEITEHPLEQAICDQSNCLFSIDAIGDVKNFQWRRNGNPIPNSNNKILSFIVNTDNDKDVYDVVVSSACNEKISNQANLSVYSLAKIISEPEDINSCKGDNGILEVIAEGKGLRYQWFKNEITIEKADSSVLPISNINIEHEGNYKVKISSVCGNDVTSRIAMLEVLDTPELKLNDTTYLCTNGEINIGTNAEYDTYSWSTGETGKTINISDYGEYWLNVSYNNGCSDRDTVNITLGQSDICINSPKAFTPNGDGINDVWKPDNFDDYENLVAKIYNRYGVLIYSFKSWETGWDPSESSVPSGDYWYVISRGNKVIQRGNVSVVR